METQTTHASIRFFDQIHPLPKLFQKNPLKFFERAQEFFRITFQLTFILLNQ